VKAQFNAAQLITQRESVSRMVKNALTARASDFHILIDDVAIVRTQPLHFEFLSSHSHIPTTDTNTHTHSLSQQYSIFLFLYLNENFEF
jgi:hypothetical protein